MREGYGTTETVTACCLTPPHMFKEGSIGVPFPDTYIKIVDRESGAEVPYGEEGEILLAGPTVMKEYMNHPDETAQTLRVGEDGLTWVHTGDLGIMDSEGFVYFRGRAKRMIITSGYNVYPGQIENILDAHDSVQMSCVNGVPDPYKMKKVKEFVKHDAGVPANDETKQMLLSYCRKNIAKYAMPYDIEFREDMPKTLVGKVAYRKLEEEETARIAAAANADAAASAAVPAAKDNNGGKGKNSAKGKNGAKNKKNGKSKHRFFDKTASDSAAPTSEKPASDAASAPEQPAVTVVASEQPAEASDRETVHTDGETARTDRSETAHASGDADGKK